jgi:hypothetical protein
MKSKKAKDWRSTTASVSSQHKTPFFFFSDL